MPGFWMVRAGEAGYMASEFAEKSVVAVGWSEAGDLTGIGTLDEMRERVARSFNGMSRGAMINSAGVLHKLRTVMQVGDRVMTYDPERREYLMGRVEGKYEYRPDLFSEYPNLRKVHWEGSVSRDDLSTTSKNTLGSTLTLFEPGQDVLTELTTAMRGVGRQHPRAAEDGGPVEEEEESEVILRDTLSRAHEFIKDRILSLSPEDMESLAAALLRAMGYKTRVTPKGPDQGRDVVASPDGLGFQSPRIIVEVKHRLRTAIGADLIRGFIGGLRSGDRGLYISTGGFTKEARYEADRSNVPITLVDSDYLATLVVEHYDAFDTEGRSLVPLRRVYWPLP